MKIVTTTFGLIHPTTLRFARFINTEEDCCIFHRLNSDFTEAVYRSQADELLDASILESSDLGVILEFLATNEWPHWNDEPEISNFSSFVPVAIIREKTRLAGIGDFVDTSTNVFFVTPKDATGAEYGLSELTVA